MKHKLWLGTSLFLVVAMTGWQVASAGIVSVNFYKVKNGNHKLLTAAESTGVVDAANWNNVKGKTASNLKDDSGTNTTVGLAVNNDGQYWFRGSGNAIIQKMETGYISTAGKSSFVITLSGLDASKTYDLYAYMGVTDRAAATVEMGAAVNSGATKWIRSVREGHWKTGVLETSFVSTTYDTELEAHNSTTDSNYIKFTGVAPNLSNELVLTIYPDATLASSKNLASVRGFQIVEAVPEPASIFLLLFGGLGLIGIRRQNRRKK